MVGQNGEARAVVTCVNVLHSLTLGRAIMEVDFARLQSCGQMLAYRVSREVTSI